MHHPAVVVLDFNTMKTSIFPKQVSQFTKHETSMLLGSLHLRNKLITLEIFGQEVSHNRYYLEN